MQRSIDKDIDIIYYSRTFRKCLEELKSDIKMLRAVDYDPHELLMEMGKAWTDLMLEYEVG